MNANPILLQMKYARVVSLFAKNTGVTLDEALKIFYHSVLGVGGGICTKSQMKYRND